MSRKRKYPLTFHLLGVIWMMSVLSLLTDLYHTVMGAQ